MMHMKEIFVQDAWLKNPISHFHFMSFVSIGLELDSNFIC